MLSKIASSLVLATAALGVGGNALANSLDQSGSLLLFPIFDNTRGTAFAITVTNTNDDQTPLGTGTLLAGTVDVEFVYINGVNCLEFNRTRRLTPNDTITVLTRLDNPNATRGYVYVFAKSPTTGHAIKWDWLEGDSLAVPESTAVSQPDTDIIANLSPVVFKAGAALANGADTDLDHDNIRDLNGAEYAQMADKIEIPRFIANPDTQLVLIGLSGGPSFTNIVNFLAYNDNEEVFSGQVSFDCWARYRLTEISGVFDNGFLLSTNNNPLESLFGTETGWIRMDGNLAFSSAASLTDPAFLAVRVDGGFFASLPYGRGTQANGDLLPHGPFGDTSP